MGMDASSIQTEMCISGNGRMIVQMEKVHKFWYTGKYLSNYGAEYDGDWKDDKQEGYGE